MASRIKRSVLVTVNDVLDGHVALDLECLDRLYLRSIMSIRPPVREAPNRMPAMAAVDDPAGGSDEPRVSAATSGNRRQHLRVVPAARLAAAPVGSSGCAAAADDGS